MALAARSIRVFRNSRKFLRQVWMVWRDVGMRKALVSWCLAWAICISEIYSQLMLLMTMMIRICVKVMSKVMMELGTKTSSTRRGAHVCLRSISRNRSRRACHLGGERARASL